MSTSSPTTSSQNSTPQTNNPHQEMERLALRRALIAEGFMVDRTSPHPGQSPDSPANASSSPKSEPRTAHPSLEQEVKPTKPAEELSS